MTGVGVVGASARAAVHSLARAGLSAWAIDLFADRDLKRIADCVACPMERYPDAIPELAARFPPGPVLYTGGLENYPHVVRELAAARELWGNPPEVLEQVRDPWLVSLVLAEQDFLFPALAFHESTCPTGRRYLRKPLRSSAGHGIRFARPGEPASPSHYFQEFVEGEPVSAVFLDRRLFGITEQLVGCPWLHARPFSYCGSIGPLDANREATDTVARIGSVLAMAFGLGGAWNADLVVKGGVPFVVEVNPRYSASVEAVEFARGTAVWSGGAAPAGGAVGKAIYYAPHAIRFPQSGPWDADLAGDFDPWRLPDFADIPEPGSVVEAGTPVLTVFAAGSTPAGVRERLQSRAAELDSLFRDAQP